jgi:ribose 5-phosphate isomerase A
VVDKSKLSKKLGLNWPLPVEVTPFGWELQLSFLKSLGGNPARRNDNHGEPYLTDQGNFIIDCDFGSINDPEKLSVLLNARAGIVEHGLFINLATDIIVAGEDGIQHLSK